MALVKRILKLLYGSTAQFLPAWMPPKIPIMQVVPVATCRISKKMRNLYPPAGLKMALYEW